MRKLAAMLLFLLLALLFLSSPTTSRELGATGRQQSPINIVESNALPDGSLGPLKTRYRSGQATMRNLGYEMRVSWPYGGGSLEIGDTTYTLVQCHWRFPAEHTINNIRFPLELQLVHQSSDGKIAEIGILYRAGPADPFITPEMLEYFKFLQNPELDEVPVGRVAPPVVESSPYYRYSGSLTTSPYTEGVIWTVLPTLRTASYEQLYWIIAALDGKKNSRPIQPLYGRNVTLFTLLEKEHASSGITL